MRPLDAAAAGDYIMEPQHLAWQAALARPRQKAAHPGAVRAAGSSDRTREQKGAFSLPEITADLLPVSGKAPLEVQHVVGDLERQPEQVAEAIEAVEVPVAAIGDERADPHRVNEAVPGGLLTSLKHALGSAVMPPGAP
jgi:hypothetical protein